MNANQRRHIEKVLFEELSKHGIVTAACKRSGLSKAQYYRWYSKNKIFQEKADEARFVGTQENNDLAKSRLLQNIDRGDMQAIRFQLSRRDPEYRLPPEPKKKRITKEDLIELSYQVVAGQVANGDVGSARFILERLDPDLMRPKDSLMLGEIRAKESQTDEIRKTGEALTKLLGLDESEIKPIYLAQEHTE